MGFLTNEARLRTLVGGHASPVDLKNDPIKLMIVKSSYTPDRDHVFVNSITDGGHELSGTGYAAGFGASGRKTLANKAFAKDDASDLVKLTADNVTWAVLNAGSGRYIAVIKEGSTDADSLLLAVHDLNSPNGITFNGQDWVFACPANGFISWT